ncbi:LacI family DNA-binding transcriptional regulator [Gilliamella sp. B2776]|uniref:LacI family DNA-binding transcriptional regulator n=1 Tax=unclassified Gilliamella TaxID=2685620 RepID=UPI002269CC7D|nr:MULTISPECIES: LacI family DNA-binding transcriptional regulator [unclassified Gilliamella]MCX8650534.1 LacI family DNA-binding transcriptional regulator [Gilliamella sp. B2779]MCX8653917.1 LacI family DNA-binding transcriptional regulator [Gilliamella sp. B2737]MCX8656896.1 LacI family DNA-binding transcriptional regulator [Gilliamella sp. B2894]MCX8665598.1 LacI family DNA-binding transcriptional regulator [Gilliamella sp. B2887]MCX8692382.1 LacI family DNA-binding transcriptional regulato
MQEIKKRKTTGQITLFDVAKYAGVGTMTVSRALRTPDRVSDKLRQKIQIAVDTLGYKPNIAASLLASASANRVIAVITTKIYDHSAQLWLNSLQTHLAKAGYTTLIIESYHYYKFESQMLDAIYSHNLEAILLFQFEDEGFVKQILKNKIVPILNIGKNYDGLTNINIGIDDSLAMYMLTEHVIKKGYQYIGLLCANQEYQIFQQRLHGWHKAMLVYHLPTYRIINAAKPANFSTGSELLPDMLLNWPELDALICTSDELACGVLYECQRRHIRVPHQLAVSGFGDNEFSQVSFPALTTIALPYKKIGEYTATLLLDSLKNKKASEKTDLSELAPVIRLRASV